MKGKLTDPQESTRRNLCLIYSSRNPHPPKTHASAISNLGWDKGAGPATTHEPRKLLLSRQQRELDLDDGDLRRPPKQQIPEQPHGHHVLQRCQVLRTPHACDGATVHGRLSVQALLRDEQQGVWCERERGAAFCGRWRAQHATDENNLSGCVRFRG
jgi:hypothetical protein